MIRFRKHLPWVALAVVALFGTANPVRAGIELDIQEDNGIVHRFTTGNFSGTIGDFTIAAAFGSSNAPGGSNALTQLAAFSVTNNDSSTAHVLHISVSATGFTSPQSPPPLNLLDTVSGSVVNGDVTGDFQGYADASDVLFGKGFASSDLTFSTVGSSKSFSADGGKGGFSPDGNTYSESIFANYSLSGGSSLTVTGGNTQTIPTPAPAGAVLALTGLPLLGIGGWLRRRKQA